MKLSKRLIAVALSSLMSYGVLANAENKTLVKRTKTETTTVIITETYPRNTEPSLSDKAYLFKVHNKCDIPIKLAIHYRNLNGNWETKGWWSFQPGEQEFIGDNNLRTQNSLFYFYAKATNQSGRYWGGDYPHSLNGQQLLMTKSYDPDEKNINLTCNNG